MFKREVYLIEKKKGISTNLETEIVRLAKEIHGKVSRFLHLVVRYR